MPITGVETAGGIPGQASILQGRPGQRETFQSPQASELARPAKPAEPCRLPPLLGPRALGVQAQGSAGRVSLSCLNLKHMCIKVAIFSKREKTALCLTTVVPLVDFLLFELMVFHRNKMKGRFFYYCIIK